MTDASAASRYPFRPWVRSTCRRAMIWGIGVLALLGIVAWLLRTPGSAPLSRAFGVLAGYWGGGLDTAVTYLSNLLNSFPRLVLILLMVAAFKPDIYLVMAVVGITNIPTVASLIKSKIQFLTQKNFIEAAAALGLKNAAIIFKHILWHNCRSVLIIQATLVATCQAQGHEEGGSQGSFSRTGEAQQQQSQTA